MTAFSLSALLAKSPSRASDAIPTSVEIKLTEEVCKLDGVGSVQSWKATYARHEHWSTLALVLANYTDCQSTTAELHRRKTSARPLARLC